MTRRRECPVCSLQHRGNGAWCVLVETRWPVEPLLALVRDQPSAKELAEMLGCSGDTLSGARERGLSDEQADRWACRLGWHPSLVWPEWIDAGLSVVDRAWLASGWRQAWLAENPTPVVSAPSYPTTPTKPAHGDSAANGETLAVVA